jgi:hypothetical protein
MPDLTSIDFNIGDRLADFLADRREKIITQWTNSVQSDLSSLVQVEAVAEDGLVVDREFRRQKR